MLGGVGDRQAERRRGKQRGDRNIEVTERLNKQDRQVERELF